MQELIHKTDGTFGNELFGETFQDTFGEEKITPTSFRGPPVSPHEVKEGETISEIADYYETTVKQLVVLNPGIDWLNRYQGDVIIIKTGEFLNVPIRKHGKLYSSVTGKLIAERKSKTKSGVPKFSRTPIFVIDDQDFYFNKEKPWEFAIPLRYRVGESAGRVKGQLLRENHPLHDKGWKYQDVVYEDELLDMTAEFNAMMETHVSYFLKEGAAADKSINKIADCWICPMESYNRAVDAKDWRFIWLMNTDAPYDLKSQSRDNLDEIPSYAAVVIGEYSFYDNRLMVYDDYGNFSYGYFGNAYGFSKSKLVDSASFQQIFQSGSGDPKRDTLFIELGFDHYDK